MWGKQKANNVFQTHHETVMHIVRRRAPTHCTNTDIVTPANGGHVQNAGPKGTSSTVWKAFQDPVKHNIYPDLSCKRSQMGCLSTVQNVTSQYPIRYTNNDISDNVWVNRNLRSQSAPLLLLTPNVLLNQTLPASPIVEF
uniref:Uncharacterized protein n=1 Tax=Tanacetum cinerariifolium TaxID=118510 RepID=A0A6L2JYU1_TANCI|nr:hypothetical protein [Tanacetum cinerariifolium]